VVGRGKLAPSSAGPRYLCENKTRKNIILQNISVSSYLIRSSLKIPSNFLLLPCGTFSMAGPYVVALNTVGSSEPTSWQVVGAIVHCAAYFIEED
jgi:hypothetical protein